jgi:penicillin G amidase
MRTLLKAILLILFVVLCLTAMGIYVTFYRAMPSYTGNIVVSGITSPVTVKWDDFQVPHVFADSEQDLYFAVGYLHAQDRLWQMTLSQLSSEGRFAEFLGVDWVPYDRHIRTIGIPDISEKIYDKLPADEKSRLQAYALGVNTWVSSNRDKLPMEFVLLNMKPIEWEPRHSIGAWRMLGWDINVSWWAEITYGYLRKQLGEPYWRELLPDYAGKYTPRTIYSSDSLATDSISAASTAAWMQNNRDASRLASSALEAAIQFKETDMAFRSRLGSRSTLAGSNAWALSGSKTASGFPMLAGDPHNSLSLPARWYEIHMNRNGQNVAGITLPGIPYIMMGQNDVMAWSFTNMMADQTDFFEERLLPGTPGYYQSNTSDGVAYLPIRIEREIIRVKGSPDEVLTIRYTDHGPLINDVFEDSQIASDVSLSMRWMGFEPTNELSALYNLNWLDRFEALTSVAEDFKVPGLNLIYADVSGNIAKLMMAQVPIRSYDNVGFAQGWETSHRWTGFVPFSDFPHVINPESGYVLDANQPTNATFHIGSFSEPYSRFRVIDNALASATTLSVEQMMSLQLETMSEHAREITERILPIIQRSNTSQRMSDALNYLINWDYRYERSATAASIFEVFFMKLAERSLIDDLGTEGWNAFKKNDQLPLRVISNMLKNDSRFFDDKNTSVVETREIMVVKAMEDAVQFLTDSLGTEPINWRWENIHQVMFEATHFSSAVGPQKDGYMNLIVTYMLNRGPFGTPGHTTSPVSGQYDWHRPFQQVGGATWRRVIDLANTSQSWSVIPGGQSGNALSRAYDDQLDLWLDGKYRIMQHNSEVRFGEQMPTMILNPSR